MIDIKYILFEAIGILKLRASKEKPDVFKILLLSEHLSTWFSQTNMKQLNTQSYATTSAV